MARFSEDIRITGIDIHQCSPSPENPRLQRIYLTLSGLPPSEWQTILLRRVVWRARPYGVQHGSRAPIF